MLDIPEYGKNTLLSHCVGGSCDQLTQKCEHLARTLFRYNYVGLYGWIKPVQNWQRTKENDETEI